MKFIDLAAVLKARYPRDGAPSRDILPMQPWTASDTLWYDYRDPWAEGAPGALERLLALRRLGGWLVRHEGEDVFIRDGESKDADATKRQLEEEGIVVP